MILLLLFWLVFCATENQSAWRRADVIVYRSATLIRLRNHFPLLVFALYTKIIVTVTRRSHSFSCHQKQETDIGVSDGAYHTIPSEIEALWIINIPENNSLETEPAFLVRITLSVLAYITNRLYSNVRGL